MEWPLTLALILGGLLFLMGIGLPVAVSFIVVDIVGVFFLWGGQIGLEQLIFSMFGSVASFNLLPIPMFVLMGDLLFFSGIAPLAMDTLDKWLGALRGRLALLAVAGGTLISTLTGSSIASVALLGSLLAPEMEKRGYKKQMSLGPIMGSGGLAVLIPPSTMAILIGALGQISIGSILIAIIIPGLLLAALFAAYIIIRCKLQPSIAPAYSVPDLTLSVKLEATARYILPLSFIVFLVVGLVLLGIATPTEAACVGAVGSLVLAAVYKRLNWKLIKSSLKSTLEVTSMVFLIIVGSAAFSSIMAYSGAVKGIAAIALGLHVSPIFIFIAMQLILLFLGCFLGPIAIMMITLPIFMPIVNSLHIDPVSFAVVFILNMEVGGLTPPFGMSLFVMKSVAPANTTMQDVIGAAVPFIYLDIFTMALVMAFPQIALWLPSFMIKS